MKYVNDDDIETAIIAKGLTAPRVTPEVIDSVIDSHEFYVFRSSNLTVCVITLKNGFTVTGESACVDPANFDEEIGRDIAFSNAKDKLWPLLGFLLADKLDPLNCFSDIEEDK